MSALTESDGVTNRPWLVAAVVGVWLGAVTVGLWQLWAYENRPGRGAAAPLEWPASSELVRPEGEQTLVVLAHPRCSCTVATLGELAEALARAHHRPRTYVVFLRPSESGDAWDHTDLWRTALAIPGVVALRDADGMEAARFGAATSGQTLLYDANGRLLFSGGITGSRGHEGENIGRTTLLEAIDRNTASARSTNVFGCPLFSSPSDANRARASL